MDASPDACGALTVGVVAGTNDLAVDTQAEGVGGPWRDRDDAFPVSDKLFTRLRATRLDNNLEAEMRKLARVDRLILDHFALRRLDPTETNDFYELIAERHRKATTIETSNRDSAEWMSMMSDALLSPVRNRPSHLRSPPLVIEGLSYRQRDRLNQRAAVDTQSEAL